MARLDELLGYLNEANQKTDKRDSADGQTHNVAPGPDELSDHDLGRRDRTTRRPWRQRSDPFSPTMISPAPASGGMPPDSFSSVVVFFKDVAAHMVIGTCVSRVWAQPDLNGQTHNLVHSEVWRDAE